MRSIVTTLVLAISSPVLLVGQSAVGAGGKLITPPVSEQAASQEPADSQPAVKDLRPSGPPIVLQASEGTLLHLSSDARTVFVADPEVADVQMSQRADFIYVVAKKGGRTTVLYAADEAGRLLLNRVIEVKAPPTPPAPPGAVALIKGAALSDGGVPTPTPGSSVTQSTLTTPTGPVEQSTTTYQSTPSGKH
jgi:hypothetical protein